MTAPRRQRSYDWVSPDPATPPLAHRSGLEFFRALADGSEPPQPITATIGWTVAAVEHGRLTLTFQPQEYLFHAASLLHGGVIATLLDSAMSGAVMTTLAAGEGCTTLQLSVNNIRAVGVGCGPLTVEGRVSHSGGRAAFASGAIRDADGRLYAEATTSCLLFKPQRKVHS